VIVYLAILAFVSARSCSRAAAVATRVLGLGLADLVAQPTRLLYAFPAHRDFNGAAAISLGCLFSPALPGLLVTRSGACSRRMNHDDPAPRAGTSPARCHCSWSGLCHTAAAVLVLPAFGCCWPRTKTAAELVNDALARVRLVLHVIRAWHT